MKSELMNNCLTKSFRTLAIGVPILAVVFISCTKGGTSPNLSAIMAGQSQSGSSSSQDSPNPRQPVVPNGSNSVAPPAVSSGGTTNSGVTAYLNFNTAAVNLYGSLPIRFSESMDQTTVENSITISTTGGGNLQVSYVWDSPIDLILEPKSVLDQNAKYTISISSNAKSAQGQALTSFQGTFNTEPSFTMTHKIFGTSSTPFNVQEGKGTIIDANQNPTISLQSTITNADKVSSLKLCKLGVVSGQSTVVCRAAVANGVELCPGTKCTQSTFSSNLNQLAIPLTNGANNYFYQIETLGGNRYYSGVNFIWADLAPNKNALISDSSRLVLDQTNIGPAVSNLIESYSRGEFTLNQKTLNQFIHEGENSTPPTKDAQGNTCLPWEKLANTNPNGPDFTVQHLTKIGPFCGITVSGSIFVSNTYPNVNYTATADVYISDMNIPALAEPGALDNVKISLENESGTMLLRLWGKKTTGQIAVVTKVKNIEFFDYLVGDTLVYAGQGQTGVDGDGVVFDMNEDPPTTQERFAVARALVSVPANSGGNVSIQTDPYSFHLSADLASYNSSSTYCDQTEPSFDLSTNSNPFTICWSKYIGTSAVDGTGAVAAIVGDVINQKMEQVKPQVVQGVVRDIAETVSPDILNNILKQIRDGVSIDLPGYLPAPLNDVQLKLFAQLRPDMVSKKVGSIGALEGGANVSVTTCVMDGSSRCPGDSGYQYRDINGNFLPAGTTTNAAIPSTPIGSDSFPVLGTGYQMPSQFYRLNNDPGLLLSLHPDPVNQAIYFLWKNGGLNLNVNKTFIDTVNNYAGTSSVLKMTESLLTADPIITVFDPGSQGKLTTGGEPIYPNDAVELHLSPDLPPVVSVLPLSGQSGQFETPKLGLNVPSFTVDIVGKRTDTARSANGDLQDGSPYLISKVRITLTSKASLGFGTFSNPNNIPDLQGRAAVQVVISDTIGDLYYFVEVLQGPGDNPLGLDPQGIWQVMDPLVQDLVVPLLNNIVGDIPLPKMQACGLQLNDLQTMTIPSDSPVPFILLHASATNYTFTGDCSL